MSILALGGTMVQYLLGSFADAKIKDHDFEGPYLWDGESYK